MGDKNKIGGPESPIDWSTLLRKLSFVPNGCVEAMESTLALCDAIKKNNLTVDDLTKICRFTIKSGHDPMQLCLSMMCIAAGRAKSEDMAEASTAKPLKSGT